MIYFSPDETKYALPETKFLIQNELPETFTLVSSDTAAFSIPLRRADRLFVMEATIDGETGNLIFDTGATGLVLNRTYFRDHVTSGELSTSGITGTAGQVNMITAEKIETGGLEFRKVPANLADLGHIENRRGIKVLGLFGFGLIKSFEITLDIEKNRLILNPIDKKGRAGFYLPGYLKSGSVYIAGSFNSWDPMQTLMTKVDSGWIASISLPPINS
jgi:hypothetical protein